MLSVIIPAYNEEKRLPETLEKVRDYLSRQNYDWEVLILNDGSKDQTGAVVSELIKDWQGFRLIDNRENKGKGGVVKQGMLEARGDWRLFTDADNSTDISEIEKLWPYCLDLGTSFASSHPNQPTRPLPDRLASARLQADTASAKSERGLDRRFAQDAPSVSKKYDIVIGSRYLKADSIKIKQPLLRRIVSRIGNWLIRILLGIDLKDTQCGFKLFSAKAAEEIFPRQTIERWGFDMEILTIAKKKGYQIKEVAVDWYDDNRSNVKKSAAFKTLKELIIIKWNLIRRKYS